MTRALLIRGGRLPDPEGEPFDLSDPAWMLLDGAVGQLVLADPARSLRHVLIDGRFVLRDRRAVCFDRPAMEAAREAPVRLDALFRRTSPGIDRDAIDDGARR